MIPNSHSSISLTIVNRCTIFCDQLITVSNRLQITARMAQFALQLSTAALIAVGMVCVVNILIRLLFKTLVLRLVHKKGPLRYQQDPNQFHFNYILRSLYPSRENPINIMILLDESAKLISILVVNPLNFYFHYNLKIEETFGQFGCLLMHGFISAACFSAITQVIQRGSQLPLN